MHVDGKALTRGAQGLEAEARRATRAVAPSDLPSDTVKRLLCDGSLVVVAEKEHGKPPGVVRTVSTALRRALYADHMGDEPDRTRTRHMTRFATTLLTRHVTDFAPQGCSRPFEADSRVSDTDRPSNQVREPSAIYRMGAAAAAVLQ